MYGCLCDVVKMQYGTPNVNLRAITPGGAGVFSPRELACRLPQMLTLIKSILRLPNCCLGKLVDKTLKQMKHAATSHNHIQLNATGQNIRCLNGEPKQMNIFGGDKYDLTLMTILTC